jgi:CheY-like chemotaxis protein
MDTVSESQSPPSKPLVLLVDDYPDTVEFTAELLQFSGFDVITAKDGGKALALVAERSPDIVLLDLSLPVIDGLEVLRRMKANPHSAGIPVIAFSAHSGGSRVDDAMAAGCAGFLQKPTAPGALVKEIRRVLALGFD